MTTILAYTSPARGHLYPIVPVLAELRDRGHAVAVRTLASAVPTMRAVGFDAAPIDPALERMPHDDYLGANPVAGLKRSVATFARRAPLDAADLRRATAEERPDLLLVDINAWGAMAAAEASGLPWATWCPYPLPIPSVDAPPFGPGLRPAGGPLGRLRDRALGPVVLGSLERTMAPPVNGVRARMGLPPVTGVLGLYGAAPLCLYLTAEPFEYPRHDWPDTIQMIGPTAWEPPSALPAWLDGITTPIVLVTTSSEYQRDDRLASVAMDALADEPVTVVVTVPAGDTSGLEPAANAKVCSFVPHGPLLDKAVCAVTHGGMGATQKALQRGVPVCAVPFGRDQLEVARRVEVAGAGTRLPARRLRADRLRDAVRRSIELRGGAERVAQAFRDAGGQVAGADAVERHLVRRPCSG